MPVRCRTFIVTMATLAVALLAGHETPASAATPVPVWPAATELPLAADANPTPASQFVRLNSVTCTSAGNCVAVGIYNSGGANGQAMVVTEAGGVWGQPSKVALPGDAASSGQAADLLSVTCTSPGNCVAGGKYRNTSTFDVAMVVTEANGTWGTASALTLPSGANNHISSVSALTCGSPGNCTAVGYYTAGTNYLAMYANETGGVWQTGQLTLPMGGNGQAATLDAVTCTSAGNCVAAGYYNTSSGYQPMVATETGGAWAQAHGVTLPSGASTTGQDSDLYSVTCTSAGNCVAVGNYTTNGTTYQSMVVTESSGVWGSASEITLPSDANTVGGQNSQLASVSCTAPGNCVAVGGYYDSNGSSDRQAMTATETGGVWDQAARLALPSGANTAAGGQGAVLESVTCTSPGACVAVGTYGDSAGARQAMTLTSVSALAVSTAGLPPAVAGVPYAAALAATGGAANYAWSIGSGALPAGLGLSASTGVISGIPAATVSSASNFTVAVNDSGPPTQQASAPLSIAVSAPAPALASFGTVTVASKGPKVTIIVMCAGTAMQQCTGTLLLTTLEHVTGHKVTTISAAKKAKKSKRTVTVGNGSYSVSGGRGITVTIGLNGTGKALLAKFHKLPAQLALTPTGASKPTATKTVTLRAPKAKTKRRHRR